MSRMALTDQDILEFIDASGMAGRDYRRGVQLIDDGRAVEHHPHVEALALIDRTIERDAGKGPAPDFAPRTAQPSPVVLVFQKFGLGHTADYFEAIGDDFDRFFRRRMAEHPLMRLVKPRTQFGNRVTA